LPAPDGARRLAVKDLFDTAGIRTTYGSAVFADHIPPETATAVTLLEGAGWTNVGKTNLHEFAYGTTSQNPHYGTVPNPRAPGRTAGGSSGGSAAALVTGEADAALGTDTGGSIRIPAACCGIAGFKPSYGLVPIDGVFPLAPSFDHAGPMAPDMAGCASLLRELVPGFETEALASLEEVTIGIAWLDRCDPLVRERLQAVAELFPRRVVVEFPTAETVVPAFMREVGDVHRELYATHGELYGENVAGKIERCLAISDGEYSAAQQARVAHAERAHEALAGCDLVLTPTLGFVAPAADVDEAVERARLTIFTFPFNALGWPAAALPCGAAEDGLPASAQIAGPAGSDALVLAAALTLERALKTS
jgi:aspartyl-tRNA(Asn)/glutamyl-tRNA(Gln) amidotransferase subunit A